MHFEAGALSWDQMSKFCPPTHPILLGDTARAISRYHVLKIMHNQWIKPTWTVTEVTKDNMINKVQAQAGS